MATKLERIAIKARCEPKFKFTSLCHHVDEELLWESLKHIPKNSSPGIDGIHVELAKENFSTWSKQILQDVHNKGYKAPPTRRVWIPKPGKQEKRPIAIPNISDRALQRSVSKVLETIYEQDFRRCSFGGRPNIGAHNALATLNEIISGKKVGWVFEADLKNFFGSLDHGWLLRFVEHRVGDPRIISLIRRWLKAGVMEEGKLYTNDTGTPQGGSISVLLSNIYLHYVLDLWFEKAIKPILKGEAYLVRYIDDFTICFQLHSDAMLVQVALQKRLEKFSLKLEPDKTRLIKFGHFAQKDAKKCNKKIETLYFLGFTHYCTQSLKGNFMVGRKTEKTRLRRSVQKMQELMKEIRHHPLAVQAVLINQLLRGHYAYYGLGGNIRSLQKLYRIAQIYWRKMLNTRGNKKSITWNNFNRLKEKYPLQVPKLKIPFSRLKAYSVL